MTLQYLEPDHAVRGKTSEHADVVRGRFVELIPEERVVEAVVFESDDPDFAGTMMLTTRLTAVSGGTEVMIRVDNAPKGIRAEDHELGHPLDAEQPRGIHRVRRATQKPRSDALRGFLFRGRRRDQYRATTGPAPKLKRIDQLACGFFVCDTSFSVADRKARRHAVSKEHWNALAIILGVSGTRSSRRGQAGSRVYIRNPRAEEPARISLLPHRERGCREDRRADDRNGPGARRSTEPEAGLGVAARYEAEQLRGRSCSCDLRPPTAHELAQRPHGAGEERPNRIELTLDPREVVVAEHADDPATGKLIIAARLNGCRTNRGHQPSPSGSAARLPGSLLDVVILVPHAVAAAGPDVAAGPVRGE